MSQEVEPLSDQTIHVDGFLGDEEIPPTPEIPDEELEERGYGHGV